MDGGRSGVCHNDGGVEYDRLTISQYSSLLMRLCVGIYYVCSFESNLSVDCV